MYCIDEIKILKSLKLEFSFFIHHSAIYGNMWIY